MPDVLITDFFKKQTQLNAKSKKRSSSKLEQDGDPEWTPANATKRSKVTVSKEKRPKDGPTEPPIPLADAEVVELDLDHPSQAPSASSKVGVPGASSNSPAKPGLFSRYRSPLPPSSAPSSSWRKGRRTLPRQESIIPPTPEHESRFLTTPNGIVSPIRLNFKPLSQTWSDETVGSSQSQEEDDLEEYGGPSINLAGTIFGAPRSNWATKGSIDFIETGKGGGPPTIPPQMTSSSQSQILRGRATIIVEESFELIPSSQSQEKELDITAAISRAGWHIRRSTTPETLHRPSSKETSSLTRELPVRRLSLREDDESGPLADDLDDLQFQERSETHLTPRRSRQETQEWDTPSQRQVASTLLELDCVGVDQSCPMISPSRSVHFGSSQALSLSQPFAFTQSLAFAHSSRVSPSTPVKSTAPANLQESQAQESSPIASHVADPLLPQPLPVEVTTFHAMFEGEVDGSYPPDFPLSLRF